MSSNWEISTGALYARRAGLCCYPKALVFDSTTPVPLAFGRILEIASYTDAVSCKETMTSHEARVYWRERPS